MSPYHNLENMEPFFLLCIGAAMEGVIFAILMIFPKARRHALSIWMGWLCLPPLLFLADKWLVLHSLGVERGG